MRKKVIIALKLLAIMEGVETMPSTRVHDLAQGLAEAPKRKLNGSAVGVIIDRATEVIRNHDEALRRLGTPVRGVGCATPIAPSSTKEGAVKLNDILDQIEHGIW